MARCSTSSITVEGRGLRELILKVSLIEFRSLWKTCGTQHPIGHEEEIGTNNFRLVEFDLFVRISNMELKTYLTLSFIHTTIYCIAMIIIFLCIHLVIIETINRPPSESNELKASS